MPRLKTRILRRDLVTRHQPCSCRVFQVPRQYPRDQPYHEMRRVVVTGLGAVTPLAAGVQQTWRRLLDSHSGIVSTAAKGASFGALPSRVAGLVPLGSRDHGRWQAQDWLSMSEERQMALFAQYAIAAAQEALDDAGWHPTRQDQREVTGVAIGSGIGNLDEAYSTSVAFHDAGYRKVSPLFVPRLLINLAAGHVSIKHGFMGPNHAATTACTTGIHAIGDASRLIMFGDADVMVAGGAESCIHPLAIAGFARARSLATDWNDAPTASSRPFDRDRAGFVIGEGAGVVVLEVPPMPVDSHDVLRWADTFHSGARTCQGTQRQHIRRGQRLWSVVRCIPYDCAARRRRGRVLGDATSLEARSSQTGPD